jgi:NAD(P)-dependent dehydrogenase (short-subunit alcohol dehydrogenase family)
VRRLQDKSIVVIGGTTGLGLSAAQACVQEGAKVVVVGRNPESGKAALKLLGDNAVSLEGDAIDPATAMKSIELCLRTWGRFDALYHVAGGSGRKMGDGPLHQITDAGWSATLSLNLTSAFNSSRAACNAFLDRKAPGSVLLMGSVLGFSPSPKYFVTHAYAATKSAVVGFVKSCASYYASHQIRFNVIAPALVETPMAQRAANDETILKFIKTKQPLDGGRIGQASDLDGAVIWLLSDESKFVTGQTIIVDGGWTVSEGQFHE